MCTNLDSVLHGVEEPPGLRVSDVRHLVRLGRSHQVKDKGKLVQEVLAVVGRSGVGWGRGIV